MLERLENSIEFHVVSQNVFNISNGIVKNCNMTIQFILLFLSNVMLHIILLFENRNFDFSCHRVTLEELFIVKGVYV